MKDNGSKRDQINQTKENKEIWIKYEGQSKWDEPIIKSKWIKVREHNLYKNRKMGFDEYQRK